MIPLIVVRYRNPEVEDRCIAAVHQFADPEKYPLVEYDNGDADESLAVVWNRLIRQSAVDLIETSGADAAVVLLNTDCFLQDDATLPILERALLSSDKVGFTGPMTDNAGSTQSVRHTFWNRGRDRVGLGVPGGSYSGKILVDHHLSGFCLMMRVAAWDDAGGFPEDAPFYGQESALIESAWAAGWHTAMCLDAFVVHLGGATAKKERDQDAEREKGAAWFRQFREGLKTT